MAGRRSTSSVPFSLWGLFHRPFLGVDRRHLRHQVFLGGAISAFKNVFAHVKSIEHVIRVRPPGRLPLLPSHLVASSTSPFSLSVFAKFSIRVWSAIRFPVALAEGMPRSSKSSREVVGRERPRETGTCLSPTPPIRPAAFSIRGDGCENRPAWLELNPMIARLGKRGQSQWLSPVHSHSFPRRIGGLINQIRVEVLNETRRPVQHGAT
jgi:hypothetical protein